MRRASECRAKARAARVRATAAARAGRPQAETLALQEAARWLEQAGLARSVAAGIDYRIQADAALLAEAEAERAAAASGILGSHRAAEQWVGATEPPARRAGERTPVAPAGVAPAGGGR